MEIRSRACKNIYTPLREKFNSTESCYYLRVDGKIMSIRENLLN